MSIIKGQNLRILLDSQIVAAATSCQIHVAANLESSSTKDSTDGWEEQEVTGKSWDGSADALVVIDSSETGLVAFDAIDLVGTEVTVVLEQTSGTQNRTAVSGGPTLTGTAIVNDISLTAGNRQNSTYTISFTGTGELTSGTAS